jgi:hypothetical protein
VKRLLFIFCLVSLLFVGNVLADDEPVTAPASTGASPSNVSYFFVACESQAVLDFTGTMQVGYDLYVQVFDQLGGNGEPLTNLLRISVSNDYQVSQVLPYNNGRTLLLGQFASAEIRMARENDPDSSIFVGTIDDTQNDCAEPSYPSSDLFDTGLGTSSTVLIDPLTGEIIQGAVISSANIFTPDGGVLNEIYGTAAQEAIVQIGARPSDVQDQQVQGRTSDAGLIFAECDNYPLSDPGRLFDSDTLVIFWSWFASTPQEAQEHIAHAQYEVYLSSDYAFRQTFPLVSTSEITLREDGNYYVFYVANLGTGFRSGDYKIDFYLTWDEAISDGYDDFGPDTDHPSFTSTCTFEVERNPWGVETEQNNPTTPLQTGG